MSTMTVEELIKLKADLEKFEALVDEDRGETDNNLIMEVMIRCTRVCAGYEDLIALNMKEEEPS